MARPPIALSIQCINAEGLPEVHKMVVPAATRAEALNHVQKFAVDGEWTDVRVSDYSHAEHMELANEAMKLRDEDPLFTADEIAAKRAPKTEAAPKVIITDLSAPTPAESPAKPASNA